MEDEIRVKDQKMINMQIMEHGANPVYMPKCNFEVRKRMLSILRYGSQVFAENGCKLFDFRSQFSVITSGQV